MQSLNFDDGLKSFSINGDESRVIRFNPGDPDLIIRYNEAKKMLRNANTRKLAEVKLDGNGNLQKDGDFEDAAQALEETNKVIRDALKLFFKADVYDTVFAGSSPFAGTADGRFVFEAFMDAVKPVLESGIAEYRAASEKRMEKYTKGYK